MSDNSPEKVELRRVVNRLVDTVGRNEVLDILADAYDELAFPNGNPLIQEFQRVLKGLKNA